jgi:hypothetical protein
MSVEILLPTEVGVACFNTKAEFEDAVEFEDEVRSVGAP